jgi:signal transduction histidine kinase
MPSDTAGIKGGRYVRFGTLAKLARVKFPEGRAGDIQLSLMLARELASPAYLFDEHAAREWIEREADAGPRDTKAQSRQAGAPWHGPKLREMRRPVLVLHGDHDPILFIFLAFGLTYMSGRASMQVVALTLAVALALLLSSVAFRWKSGVPDDVYRWFNLTGTLMALSIDATMLIMLRRTLEVRAQRLVRVEREAAQLQRRIAQQERLESIGKLAGGVAHDFNNLLAIILNYAAFVAEAAEDRPDLLPDIEQVQSAAQRAVALTRQLLIFGRRDLVHDEVVDINKVIADSERLLRSAVGEDIEFRAKLAASAPQVRMDTSHLEQVLLNLSVNARDAMPDGGSLLIATAQCRFTDEEGHGTAPGPGPYVCLSVSDTGTGFTDEARQHVFEPFFTTKPAGRGTGLGLATVYGIAKEAGGDIQLDSEPGLGTTVRPLDITRAYVRAFFDQHLGGTPQGLLDQPSARYPEVTFCSPETKTGAQHTEGRQG